MRPRLSSSRSFRPPRSAASRIGSAARASSKIAVNRSRASRSASFPSARMIFAFDFDVRLLGKSSTE